MDGVIAQFVAGVKVVIGVRAIIGGSAEVVPVAGDDLAIGRFAIVQLGVDAPGFFGAEHGRGWVRVLNRSSELKEITIIKGIASIVRHIIGVPACVGKP